MRHEGWQTLIIELDKGSLNIDRITRSEQIGKIETRPDRWIIIGRVRWYQPAGYMAGAFQRFVYPLCMAVFLFGTPGV